MPPHVRAVAGGMKLATMAALQTAMEYPDKALYGCFHTGFTICGDIEPCEVYPHKHKGRSSTICELPHTEWRETVHSQLHYGWRTANAKKRASLLAITEATDAAVEGGLAAGPMTIAQLDKEFPEGWRCMVRFPAAADRPCDDAC